MEKRRTLTKEDIGKTFIIDYEFNGVLKKVTERGVYFKFDGKNVYAESEIYKGLIGFLKTDKFKEKI